MKHIHSPCNQEAFIPISKISVVDPDPNYFAGPRSDHWFYKKSVFKKKINESLLKKLCTLKLA